jgi:protein TonB
MNHVRPGFRRRFKVPRGALGAADAPFATALKVGQRRDGARIGVAIVLGLLAHVSIPLFAWLNPAAPPVVVERKEIPIAMVRPPPPKPPPPEPPKPEPPKPPEARHVRRTPPPPSQAPKVIAAKPDPSQTVDMSGFSMPVGESDVNTGGFVSSEGVRTAKPVIDEVLKPHAPPPPPKPSLARPPEKLSGDWNCPWPGEEEGSDLNAADAVLDIKVDQNGETEEVKVLKSPNPNFAAAAKSCSFQERRFQPGLDDDGNPVAAEVHSFVIHFTR